MFETAEIGNRLSREEYNRETPALREELLELQTELKESPLRVVIIVGGVEGAGKGDLVNLLLEWMDVRGIDTYAFGELTDEERERPRFWRYWRALPSTGRIGILFGSWYTEPIVDRAFKRIRRPRFDQELQRIDAFEEMLAREGTVLIKLWLHLSRAAQKERHRALLKDPRTRWRVSARELGYAKLYQAFRTVSERALRRTSTEHAPWNVIEATDFRYCSLTATRLIRDGIRVALQRAAQPGPPKEPDRPSPQPVNVLRRIDLSRKLTPEAYEEQLPRYQGRLARLNRELALRKRSLTVVFEGPDAAGKGGAIRRVTSALDARNYRVISVAAPTDEERAHPYLWRFWRHLPRTGQVSLYDRSWYGRVLVERIEGFCSREDWMRGYREINAFEEELVEFGTIVVKFWLHVSSEEQLRRFQERQNTPYKHYKITDEDWRNREKWSAYEAAACEMIERTSTEIAPWTLVSAEDKPWARIEVLKTICDRVERALKS